MRCWMLTWQGRSFEVGSGPSLEAGTMFSSFDIFLQSRRKFSSQKPKFRLLAQLDIFGYFETNHVASD